jgi:hypothetical protein
MENMINNAPAGKLHNMSNAEKQTYLNLESNKSALEERLKLLMVHDRDF